MPASSHRQNAVLNAFKHAWAGYSKYAWGHDHVKPITKRYQDWFNLGLTIVDSLDTLWIMNLRKGIKLLVLFKYTCYYVFVCNRCTINLGSTLLRHF